jgi:hypothetical protein
MPNSQDVAQFLREAAQADSLAEQQRLVGEAEKASQAIRAEAQTARDVDLASAIIGDRFAPVPVFSHVTATSDWLDSIDTAPDPEKMAQQLTAEATLWYEAVSPEVKAEPQEFGQHLAGRAAVVAGAFGQHSENAYTSFVGTVNELRTRDVRTGAIKEAAAQQGMPGSGFGQGNYDNALPLEATTSERAPQIQELEANNGSGASQDVVPVNDPALGQSDPSADLANGDAGTQRDGSNMNGNQRSASRHEAYSGLDQVQQTVDPSDTQQRPTQLPQDVAFPWVLSPNNVTQSISQAEQQIAERDQRRGAARRATVVAQEAARQAYAAAMKQAGYDDSGWAGDMGAGGYQPGVPPQGAGGSNLGQAPPPYGTGGDNGNQPLKPYGADEANDYTNNPGDNLQPGADLHADVGGRVMTTGSRHGSDPEIRLALKFIATREAWLDQAQG